MRCGHHLFARDLRNAKYKPTRAAVAVSIRNSSDLAGGGAEGRQDDGRSTEEGNADSRGVKESEAGDNTRDSLRPD